VIDAESVKSREEFVQFVAQLRQQLRTQPASVENSSLEHFLEALQAWTEDAAPDLRNPWTLASQLLRAGAVYE
jgi:hypothetical protein